MTGDQIPNNLIPVGRAKHLGTSEGPRRTDRQENGLLVAAGLREGLVSPWSPIKRVG